jgi:hypothetical protein
MLARTIGQAGQFREPRDTHVAGRFGVLTWGFLLCAILPAVAYGADVENLQRPTLVLIGLVNVVFIFYLFMTNRRDFLGGPGPRDWTSRFAPKQPGTTQEGRPERDGPPDGTSIRRRPR